MNMISIQGIEEINEVCNAAFCSTLHSLYVDGLITENQLKEYYKNNFALYVHKDCGIKNWFRNLFGKEGDGRVIICKHYNLT